MANLLSGGAIFSAPPINSVVSATSNILTATGYSVTPSLFDPNDEVAIVTTTLADGTKTVKYYNTKDVNQTSPLPMTPADLAMLDLNQPQASSTLTVVQGEGGNVPLVSGAIISPKDIVTNPNPKKAVIQFLGYSSEILWSTTNGSAPVHSKCFGTSGGNLLEMSGADYQNFQVLWVSSGALDTSLYVEFLD